MPEHFEPTTATDDAENTSQMRRRIVNDPTGWPQLPPWLGALVLLVGGGAGGAGMDWFGTQALQSDVEELHEQIEDMQIEHDKRANELSRSVSELTRNVREMTELVNAIHPDPRRGGTP